MSDVLDHKEEAEAAAAAAVGGVAAAGAAHHETEGGGKTRLSAEQNIRSSPWCSGTAIQLGVVGLLAVLAAVWLGRVGGGEVAGSGGMFNITCTEDASGGCPG